MTDNADPSGINFRQVSQGGVTVCRSIRFEGEPLDGRLVFPVAPRRACSDGERYKAALGQLVAEIAQFLAKPRSRLRVIVRHDDRRKGTVAVGHQQDRRMHQAGGHLNAHPMLREVLAALRLHIFDLGFLQQRRPRTHLVVPILENFRASRRPLRRGRHRAAIVEFQWRRVTSEVPGKLRRRPEKRLESCRERRCCRGQSLLKKPRKVQGCDDRNNTGEGFHQTCSGTTNGARCCPRSRRLAALLRSSATP